MSTASVSARPLGRPRDPRVDAAIVEATLRLLVDLGYGALTMEAVAGLAGVGKATLYRRYAGKEHLVVDAVASLAEPAEVVEGAGVRDELVARLDAMRRRSGSIVSQIFPRLLSASVDNPELLQAYERQIIEPRRAAFRAVLQRAVAEGLVRSDVDLEHALDLLLGPMAYRNLRRSTPPPGPDLAARIVDDVLVALAPRPVPCPHGCAGPDSPADDRAGAP